MDTVTITMPNQVNPLPTGQQDLMTLLHDHWQKLSADVRAHNKSLDSDSDEVFVRHGIEGMLRAPTRTEIMAVMPAKVNAAAMLGWMNYQVENGGWSQWIGNEYDDTLPALKELLESASRLGIDGAGDALAILLEVEKRRNDETETDWLLASDDEDDDEASCYDDLDTRYYSADRIQMMQEILDRFEDVAVAALPGLSKAA